MPHRVEEKTCLFTLGLQKGEELLCKGRTSCQDGGTNTYVFLSRPLTERQQVYITKRGTQQGSKLKTPERKPSLELGWLERVTTETQHHPQGRSEI